jgi:hypothetical protein
MVRSKGAEFRGRVPRAGIINSFELGDGTPVGTYGM